MPLVCTCGATLPEDARFCHRCGKPQREDDRVFAAKFEPAAANVAPPPLPVSGSTGSISFSNPLAIRTSFLVASLTMVLMVVPIVNAIAPLLGGYLSASLYQRRSGRVMSAGAGAKLGWMTSVVYILFITILLTVTVTSVGGALLDQFREAVRSQGNTAAQNDVLQMFSGPYALAKIVLLLWIVVCGFMSLSAVAGGALGARLYRPRSS